MYRAHSGGAAEEGFDAPGSVDLTAAYAYPERQGEQRPWVRANMVASLDGAAWLRGVSGALSGPADRKIFSLLRGLADVILVGANTVRVEGYGPATPRASWAQLRRGRPPAPLIAVVTSRLDLDLSGAFFTQAPGYARPIVYTTELALPGRRKVAEEWADVVVIGADRVDLAAAVEDLGARGHRRVLCEGGPRLLGHLAAAQLLDELCLTVSPLITCGDAARVTSGPALAEPLRLRLRHVIEDDGFLFLSYTRPS